MSVARVILIVIGAVLSICGTYVFAIFYGFPGYVGSGLGFWMNIPDLFADAALIAGFAGIEVWLFFVLLFLFLIFTVAGFLQLIGLKSKVVGLIFSLFPLVVGIMFLLLFYTEILGTISALFAFFFMGEQLAGVYPIFIDLGGGVGLGAFLLIGGGLFGFIGSLLPKD